MNIPEATWQALRKGRFPFVVGPHNQELRIAYLHGMWVARSYIVQMVESGVPPSEVGALIQGLTEQLEAELARNKEKPGKLQFSFVPNQVKPTNGDIPA